MSNQGAISAQEFDLRVLKFLRKAPAKPEQAGDPTMMILTSEHGAVSVAQDRLVELARIGFLMVATDQKICLSEQGQDFIRLQKNEQLVEINLHMKGKPQKMKVNLAESPLALLYRMKGAQGQNFLTEAEFNAGERLRADFTRGSMMPRVTSNWAAMVNGNSRGAVQGGAELSDFALHARLRVEQALDAVGPELSGALVDVCCFLKTIGQVESERRWPARSAKMMIKTGLSILHRHYHPVAGRGIAADVLHWGTSDYRPSV